MTTNTHTHTHKSRVLVWFSCGAASAVAAKMTVAKYGNQVEMLYCDTSQSEHPDNGRFCADVEKWVGLPVKMIRNKDDYKTVDEVFERYRYMSGIAGARCTVEMKKKPRFVYQQPDDIHVFGMTLDEQRRITQFENNNPELRLDWILRDLGLNKTDCLQMLTDAGIELPMMYRLGFKNNNCIGCVKAQSPAYWNLTRQHFPDVFKRRAEQSRRLGVRLCRYKGKRVFLDELPVDTVEIVDEDLSCGPQCSSDPKEA